jgi:hypothetical protein
MSVAGTPRGLKPALLFLLAGMIAWGQGTTGTIFGNVADQSGGAIANAQVTATNTGTGLARTVNTNGSGEYRMELMPIGQYRVQTSAPGFSKFIQNGVVLAATQSARVDAVLKAGNVSQQVEVTAAAPLVNTNNAEMGTTVADRISAVCETPEISCRTPMRLRNSGLWRITTARNTAVLRGA